MSLDLDIVVVNYKTDNLLAEFLESVEEFYPELVDNVLIYDVESERDWGLKWNFISNPENCGYAYACNVGAQFGSSDFVGFFNADTRFVDSQCLTKCLAEFDDQRVGAVGPMQTNSLGEVTHAGIGGTLRKPKHYGWKSKRPDLHRKSRDVISVSGSAYLTKRSVWDEMWNCPTYREEFPDVEGAFVPTPLYYEETGYSYHLIAHGYKIRYCGNAFMIHEHNKSPGSYENKGKIFKESRAIFRSFCRAHKIPHD